MTLDTLIAAIQGIVVASLVLVGQVAVARLSKKAKADQTDVSSQTQATNAWQAYAKKMEERLDRLERRFEGAERQHEEDRSRIQRLEREQTRDLDLVSRLLTGLRWALNEVSRFGGEIPAQHASAVVSAEDRLRSERKDSR